MRIFSLSVLSLVAGFIFMAAAASDAKAMTLIGVFDENDPFPSDLLDSAGLAKCDDVETGDCVWENGKVEGENYADGDIVVTLNESDGEVTSGTWSFAANGGESLAPTYLVVKAGDYYAVYSLEISPGVYETSGSFDTSDIPGSPAISHITFYDGGVPPIPEPASWIMMIFGFWLVGWRLRGQRSPPRRAVRAHA